MSIISGKHNKLTVVSWQFEQACDIFGSSHSGCTVAVATSYLSPTYVYIWAQSKAKQSKEKMCNGRRHVPMPSALWTTRRQTNSPTTNSPTDKLADKPTRRQSNSPTNQLADRPTRRQLNWPKQEAQLMLTTGSTRLAVSRGQQTWYHSTCNI